MKKYLTASSNRGTTIILDSVEQVCKLALEGEEKVYQRELALHGQEFANKCKLSLEQKKLSIKHCIDAIQNGNSKFKSLVEERIEELEGLVDEINPLFSQQRAGWKRTMDGVTSTADLIASGEELNTLSRNACPFEIKEGRGDGAYRAIINTDVSWWGNPVDNCALVGCIVTLLQRYAPVEIWIQQGWLGQHKEDGITLFKLDFAKCFDVTALAFWICHPGKDSPFSYYVNRALGRKSSATSCSAEIDCDIMLRGDWMKLLSKGKFKNIDTMLYTERTDLIAEYISKTCFKILTGNANDKPNIEE